MLNKFEKTAAAYDQLYEGKVVLVKVSGAEISGENFPKLVEDIRWMIEKKIRVVLIFGGGDQITKKFKEASGKDRPKIDGIGVTDPEVLTKGVVPSFNEIRAQLKEILLPETIFIEPKAMICEIHPDPRYGLVGTPQAIELPDAPLSAVGFVGTAGPDEEYPQELETETGARNLNVNADDVAVALVKQYSALINELIFITKEGGVRDKEWNLSPLLTDKRLERILSGEDPDIPVEGGMKKKVEAILSVLKKVGKIAITDARGLRSEIERWKGTGTFCADTDQMQFEEMQPIEEPIFDEVYEEFVQAGIFRQRTPEEIAELKRYHVMLRVKNSPLGGLSLVPKEGGWLELSALWAGTVGNGVGQILLDSALKKGQGRLYALALESSAESIKAFQGNPGFRCLGKISEARKNHCEELPPHLRDNRKYDVTARDPYVFVGVAG
ncbi:hypothetical protein A3J34_04230 [Candidatus Peribacteria bacterium RIFCSPLOWO2_02_FULL_51_10]|nr:MAG: hypothetical protein A3C52_03620 [Candidatus Peribacteria bacterium RIFCSPHIGHO2_02_FULL_51_15]OGJ69391.1 MAG: hypothetical protein A3J34_04230 [Candidatus Peribacteria bacterium RIFCSPLOWO2_02_FULL_51_10]